MSNWSHVAGIIRIDDIRFFRENIPDFEEIIGKSVGFGEPIPDGEILPMGSEGSLNMSVWINPDESEIASYVISIFGDLRDHDSPSEIINWFKEKCNLINEVFIGVRNACITVNNEWHGMETWSM